MIPAEIDPEEGTVVTDLETGTAETDQEIDIERGKMTNIGTNIEVTFDSDWFIQYLLISDWLKQ